MVIGSWWSRTNSSKKRHAMWDASEVFERGMKWPILEKWSTTTIMESSFHKVFGETQHEIHTDILPWCRWHRQRSVQPCILLGQFCKLTSSTPPLWQHLTWELASRIDPPQWQWSCRNQSGQQFLPHAFPTLEIHEQMFKECKICFL